MKKIISLLLIVLLALSGCSEEKTLRQPAEFYYCGVPGEYSSAAVMPEVRELGEEHLTWRRLVERYLEGPVAEGLRTPFPEGTELEEARLDNGVLYLTFNEAFASLSGVSLTMASACLTYTMTQFPEVSGVCIQTTGNNLAEQLSQVLTRNDFLLEDDTVLGDTSTMRVYFPDAEGRWLKEETRLAELVSQREAPIYLLQQLLLGSEESAFAVLPPQTQLLDVQVADGICTVDLSGAFLEEFPQNPAQARLSVLAVVNTLTQLEEIRAVRFLCEGAAIPTGYYPDLSAPLVRDPAAVLDARGGSRIDAELYVAVKGTELLTPIPCKLQQYSDRHPAEQVLTELLRCKSVNDLVNPIPEGALAVEVAVEDGLCTVCFNSAFALCDEDPVQAALAVRSVVTTLCALEDVERVQLKVYHAEMTQVDLSRPMTAVESWILQ